MKYEFQVTLLANFEVEGENRESAEQYVRLAIDGNLANFGAWPNGDPVLATVEIEGELECEE